MQDSFLMLLASSELIATLGCRSAATQRGFPGPVGDIGSQPLD